MSQGGRVGHKQNWAEALVCVCWGLMTSATGPRPVAGPPGHGGWQLGLGPHQCLGLVSSSAPGPCPEVIHVGHKSAAFILSYMYF